MGQSFGFNRQFLIAMPSAKHAPPPAGGRGSGGGPALSASPAPPETQARSRTVRNSIFFSYGAPTIIRFT